MKRIAFLILFLPMLGLAQSQASFPRDTSYTVSSAYQKLHKSFPFIKIVQADLPEGVEQEKDIVYRSLGDRKLHLDIFYPEKKRKERYPAVLLIHGGGWRTGDRSLMYPLAQKLAASGYVAVTAEYRLSLEASYPAAVHDLKTAVRWMRAKAGNYPIDTTSIAVLGCSAGGQLAALIGTTNGLEAMEGKGAYQEHSSAVQAIIDIDGVLAFKHPESEEGKMAAQWLGGTYEEVPENWIAASALTHAGATTPPTLFIGSAYPRFLAGRADMTKILDAHDIYNEAHFIQDAPHSFWLMHPWFEPTLDYTLEFLERLFK